MELTPFDPAEYLDSEEAISAYLEDARRDGAEAYARAVEVVARAREKIGRGRAAARAGSAPQKDRPAGRRGAGRVAASG